MAGDAEARAREVLAQTVETVAKDHPLFQYDRTAYHIREAAGAQVWATTAIRAMLTFAASEPPAPVESRDGDVDALTGCADDQLFADVPVESLRAALATPSSDPIAGERETLERAAKVAERGIQLAHDGADLTGFSRINTECRHIAAAIRALTGSEPSADAIAATGKGGEV
jgi:hypothetical protein